jgi:general secretion pathway protein G
MNTSSQSISVLRPLLTSSCDTHRRRTAFTLIEVMAVILIIAILSALIIGLWRYAMLQSLRSKAKAELQKVQDAVEEYRINNGKFPQNLSYVVPTLVGHFIIVTNYPVDPWGQPYRFELNQSSYRLYSSGPDMSSGVGTNMTDDIEAGK